MQPQFSVQNGNHPIFIVGSSDDAFTKTGFRNWKNATGEKGKLCKHAKSRMHMLSVERMQRFNSLTTVGFRIILRHNFF